MSTSGSHYKAVAVGVDGTVTIPGSRVGGFIAATAGSIQFTIRQENVPDVVLPAVPLSAGQEWDIEFFAGTTGRSVLTASGGCSGVLFYS